MGIVIFIFKSVVACFHRFVIPAEESCKPTKMVTVYTLGSVFIEIIVLYKNDTCFSGLRLSRKDFFPCFTTEYPSIKQLKCLVEGLGRTVMSLCISLGPCLVKRFSFVGFACDKMYMSKINLAHSTSPFWVWINKKQRVGTKSF